MNFPEPDMNRSEAMELWIKERTDYAKEQVVLANIKLVGFVLKSLNLKEEDGDLFSVGIVGLIKAINKFDSEKGVEFSAFSTVVIKNEILRVFRKKRVYAEISLDENCKLRSGEEVPYAEIIPGETDFENYLISKDIIKSFLDGLTEREKKMIGLSLLEGKTQREIAEETGVSRSHVSRILNGALKKCKKELDY